CQQYDDMLFTF
nr:immunoglobulin light chain junction region [Macaca mulatta]MOX52920.1 immunoglobulin light chain junction region [Macaca mulatta]MOX53625.1 immunoglobulin light chain junction region [Macaca mulatta]MOX53822.1 immunoglobulin light chain junction region [Macaca mulatta]MOX55015.1 immunoglobulin light chain junction region [Macaca mulatta]